MIATFRSDDEGPPPGFSFRHALTQEALYGELLEAERQTIHAQTLAIFESKPDESVSIAALAYHAWAARDADKRRYDDAIADQQRAVDFTVRGDDRRQEAEARAILAATFLFAGRLALAAATC